MRGCAARTWEESHTLRNFEIGQGQHLLMFSSWRTESADVQRQIVGRLCHEILQKKFCKMDFPSSQMETLHAMHTFSSNIDSVTITKRSRLLKYSNTDQRAMWMTILSQSVTHLWLNQLISFVNDNYICSTWILLTTSDQDKNNFERVFALYGIGWRSFSCLRKKAHTAWRKLWQPQLHCLIQLWHYFDWIFNSKKSKCCLLGLGEALSVCLSLPAGTAWLERQLGASSMPVSKQQGHLGESHPCCGRMWGGGELLDSPWVSCSACCCCWWLKGGGDWMGVEKYTVDGR